MAKIIPATENQVACHKFSAEFTDITGLKPAFDHEYQVALEKLVTYLTTRQLRPFNERKRYFIAHINRKFRLNAHGLRRFYSATAKFGITFHYHQKCEIQRAFDSSDSGLLRAILEKRKVQGGQQEHLLSLFQPIHENQTLEHLRRECREPSKLRIEKGGRNIENEIIKAQFSAFMWVSLSEREMHRFFDPSFSDSNYKQSFWDYLHSQRSHLFSRDNTLYIVRISPGDLQALSGIIAIRNSVCGLIQRLYTTINNYGFLAVIIDPIEFAGRSIQWELAADIMLFGEKHRELSLTKYYFQWKRVSSETQDYIKLLDINKARFDLVNEGFTYRDCFVLAGTKDRLDTLMLIFQKNDRDETLVPCPTCRSNDFQGNSYSSLGVRSWECNNSLCPDRSKYNRGKRYSFRGLAMQQAINDDRNEIPVKSVRLWIRDVVNLESESQILEMLVRHYSIYGDTIHLHGWKTSKMTLLGRNIKHHKLILSHANIPFWDGPFFKRYIVQTKKPREEIVNLGDEAFQVLVGDSAGVMRNLPTAVFDGAVTSPPYYNAREYAQWPNIYCYLYDMFDNAQEVFRTLKPGAYYLYNIFDYFDNENTVVFSLMGQRRMLLSAYTIDLFRRAGFELRGNVVWDKGDIEGKRGFNAGNFSPYYQSPFNCWEHVLIFRKPCGLGDENNYPLKMLSPLESHILKAKPVMKMVRGKNTHGHTAPFPDEIPELLISKLAKGAVVLDPFAGSLTTGRVADRYGIRSVCIELSEEYCKLGLRMLKEEREARKRDRDQLSLF